MSDFILRTLLKGDGITINGGDVDTAAGSTDVKGNPMGSRSKGEVVSPNFVGHISVTSNTITTDQNNIHLTTTHQQTTRSINNHGRRHATTTEFPSGESGPLQARAGFIQPGMLHNSSLMAGHDHTKSRTDSSRGDRTGVTVMKNTTILRQNSNAVIDQSLGESTILRFDCGGEALKLMNVNPTIGLSGRLHPIKGPTQIDGGRPGRA